MLNLNKNAKNSSSI